MELLNHFNQELNVIEKQRVELQKRAKLVIKALREKFQTQHHSAGILRNVAERIAEKEFVFDFLEQYYNKGYHELACGASYSQILKRYHGDEANVNTDSEDYFDLVIEEHQSGNASFKVLIKLGSDMDTIEDIICSIESID